MWWFQVKPFSRYLSRSLCDGRRTNDERSRRTRVITSCRSPYWYFAPKLVVYAVIFAVIMIYVKRRLQTDWQPVYQSWLNVIANHHCLLLEYENVSSSTIVKKLKQESLLIGGPVRNKTTLNGHSTRLVPIGLHFLIKEKINLITSRKQNKALTITLVSKPIKNVVNWSGSFLKITNLLHPWRPCVVVGTPQLWWTPIDFCRLRCAATTPMTGLYIPWYCPTMTYAVFLYNNYHLFSPQYDFWQRIATAAMAEPW